MLVLTEVVVGSEEHAVNDRVGSRRYISSTELTVLTTFVDRS